MPIDSHFREWVRERVISKLRACQVTQTYREAGERVGVSSAMISDYRNGKCEYELAGLLVVLLAHGMSLRDLADEFTAQKILDATRPHLQYEDADTHSNLMDAAADAMAKLAALKKKRTR